MFRYRAWNVNGAGEYSEVAYLIAAGIPARPPTPEYGSSTDSQIQLFFRPSSDDGGLIITAITLEITPIESDSWAAVASYDGYSMSHTITTSETDSPITSFSKYRFRIKATNGYGTSEPSEELVIAVAPLPSKFDSVSKDQFYSTDTTIMVRWTDPAGEVEEILGYSL